MSRLDPRLHQYSQYPQQHPRQPFAAPHTSSSSSSPATNNPHGPSSSSSASPFRAPQQPPNDSVLAGHPYPSASPSAAAYTSQLPPSLSQQQAYPPYFVPHPYAPPYDDRLARPESPSQALQDDPESPLDGSPLDPTDPNDPKKARACESCRGLKVRCDRDPNSDQPCLRCAKAKRQCIVTEPSRKRQKKTDSRVAELERKIERLSALLPAHVQDLESPPRADGPEDSAGEEAVASAGAPDSKRAKSDSPAQKATSSLNGREMATRERVLPLRTESSGNRWRPPHATIPEGCDIPENFDKEPHEPVSSFVSRRVAEIVDAATASRIFEHYVSDMAGHMPAVVFPPGTRADDVRKQQPILFLSILVAASIGMAPSAMQMELHALLLSTLADSVISNVEKRLDVVQALLVAVIWYRPPRRYEQMNFYFLAHSAGVLAVDLGLGKRNKPGRPPPGVQAGRGKPIPAVSDSIEARRTWLGCYFQCATNAMCLRRPSLIQWSKYIEESVELLEKSRDALESDKLLCQHVKLMRLNEEIGQAFSMDDPSAPVNIADAHIQDALRGFEGALRAWRGSAQSIVWNSRLNPRPRESQGARLHDYIAALEYSEKVTSLYTHEIALHTGHNVDDFRAPFSEDALKASTGQGLVLSPAHSKALLDCLRSVHSIFEIFFSFEVATVRSLPIFFFVRIGYALVVLVRLHFAVMAPDSEISKLISQDDVGLERNLGRLLKVFETVHSQESFRPATKFLVMVRRLNTTLQESKKKPSANGKKATANTSGTKRGRAAEGAGAGRNNSATDVAASTPLDLLSQVATADVSKSGNGAGMGQNNDGLTGMAGPGAYDMGQGWANGMAEGNDMMATAAAMGGNGEYPATFDFSQAVDLTMSGVVNEGADLGWLFDVDMWQS